jgi:23S rRNA maturation mini-RNase III
LLFALAAGDFCTFFGEEEKKMVKRGENGKISIAE